MTLQRVARVGFAGRGVLYALIALLAGRTAVGLPGEAGAQGAFEALAGQPLGVVALVGLAGGLAAFGGWSALSAVRGGEDDPMERARKAFEAVLYGGLALLAGSQVIGAGGGGSQTSITRQVLEVPVGRFALGAVGVAIVVAGGWRGWRAGTDDLREALSGQRKNVPDWARPVGRVGYVGRGLALILVGAFIVHGAITFDPSASGGLDAALDEVSRSLAGRLAVAVVAAGLACLAVWYLLLARHGLEDG